MRTLDRLELLPNMGIELGFSTRAASVLNCLGIFPALVLWFFSVCLLFSFTFILYVCIFACMYVVCVPCTCIFPKKIRNLVKMIVRHWGIKPGLCGRAACPLYCRAISSSYHILNIYCSLMLQPSLLSWCIFQCAWKAFMRIVDKIAVCLLV